MCNTTSYLLNINLRRRSIDLFPKSSFEWIAVLEKYCPSPDLATFRRFRPKPYTRLCVSTLESFSISGKTTETKHCEKLIESGFWEVFSQTYFLCI